MSTEHRGTPSDPDWTEEAPASGLDAPDPVAADPAAPPLPQPPSGLAGEPTTQRERDRRKAAGEPGTMLPARERRRTKAERGLVRTVATAGIVGIDVLLGAILGGQDVAGWIIGLVIGLLTVILAAVLWSSRSV
jgi:hypothetical protein